LDNAINHFLKIFSTFWVRIAINIGKLGGYAALRGSTQLRGAMAGCGGVLFILYKGRDKRLYMYL
jgi:hypothetical protein